MDLEQKVSMGMVMHTITATHTNITMATITTTATVMNINQTRQVINPNFYFLKIAFPIEYILKPKLSSSVLSKIFLPSKIFAGLMRLRINFFPVIEFKFIPFCNYWQWHESLQESYGHE